MQQPLVSVLMTAYNRQDFIETAINSVLASSYTNFELIIVDDCSTDNTVFIAKQFQQKDDRVKLFVNEKNLGDYPNRNKAASLATGKYLKYVDADDLIYPWGLGILVNCMEQFVSAGWGLCSLLPDKNNIYPFALQPKQIFEYNFNVFHIFRKAPLSAIITKEAFDSVGGFSGKQHLGDYELWHLLALKKQVVLMPDGLVWYRHHINQQNTDNKEKPEVSFKYLVSEINFYKTCKQLPFDENYRRFVVKRQKKIAYKIIRQYFKRLQFKNAFKLLRMMNDTQYNFRVVG